MGVFYVKKSFHGEFSGLGKEFFMEGEPDFPTLFENNQKKKLVFQLKVRSNIKT